MIKKYLNYKKSLEVQRRGMIINAGILILLFPEALTVIISTNSKVILFLTFMLLITYSTYVMIRLDKGPKY